MQELSKRWLRLDSQRNEVSNYSRIHNLTIDQYFEVEMSSRKDEEARRIDELKNLNSGDVIITTEISRLGRSLVEVVQLVNFLVKKNVRVIAINQGLDNENNDWWLY